jgi:hypothetical protein
VWYRLFLVHRLVQQGPLLGPWPPRSQTFLSVYTKNHIHCIPLLGTLHILSAGIIKTVTITNTVQVMQGHWRMQWRTSHTMHLTSHLQITLSLKYDFRRVTLFRKCCTCIPTICSVWKYGRKMKITVFWDDSVHFGSYFQRLAGRHCIHHFTCTSTPKKGTSSTFLQNADNHLPDTVRSNTNVNLHGDGNLTHDIL